MGTRSVYADVGGALAAVADTSTPVPGGTAAEVFISEYRSENEGSVIYSYSRFCELYSHGRTRRIRGHNWFQRGMARE